MPACAPELEAAEVGEVVPCPLRLRAAELLFRERGEVPRTQASRAHPDNRFGPLQDLLGLVEVDRVELFVAAVGGLVGAVL